MSEPEHRSFDVTFPSRVKISKKKLQSLNLNIYRNLHHFQLNLQKKNLKELVRNQLKSLPKLGRVDLHYTIFHNTKAKIDTMNVGSIASKYFEDALVEFGILEDDNHLFIRNHTFCYGGHHSSPKVDVIITEIKPRKPSKPRKAEDMRILLDQADIQEALNNHVQNVLTIEGSTSVKITYENDELIAEVILGDTEIKTKPAPKKSRGGRPKGSKNKPKTDADPKEDSTDVDANSEANAQDSSDSDSSGSDKPTTAKSTLFSEDETEESSPANSAASTGDKKSKNLFEDSDAESSTTEGNDETEEKTDTAPKEPVKSIFDQ